MIVLAADGRVLAWNRSAERLYAVPAAEAVGRPLDELFEERPVEGTGAAPGRTRWRGRCEHVTRTGRRLVVDQTVATLPEPGREDRRVIIVHDVTERRETALALQESQRFNERVTSAVAVGVFVFDLVERRDVYVNRALERMLGYTADEVLAMGAELIERAVHPDDLPVVEALIGRLMAARDEDVVEGEYRCLHKNGDWLLVHARSVVFERDAEGRATHVLGSLEDVTEQRRAQEELRHYRDELERRVRERTEDLEAAYARLEAFSHSVSHDLRAPLRTMVNLAEITLEDCGDRLDAEERENLERIVAAGVRANQLVGALMRLGQVTHAPLDLQAVDLGVVAREIVEELRRDEPARRVDVVIRDGLTARCDPALVRIVLGNLLHNAWKYTRERDPAHVEVGWAAGDDRRRVFFVRDDGIGFEPAGARQLFQAFRRLHADARYEGMGVGLSNAARAVRRHGGRIWATGEPGRGATFWFTLPD